MFVALWEFEVKPSCEERFERVYGPDGEWVRLFRGDTNYQGTRLLREASRDGIYMTLDFWRSRELRGARRRVRRLDGERAALGSFENSAP